MMSAVEAIRAADWYARYALDLIDNEASEHHPGVRTHLCAGTVQLTASVGLLTPTMH